MRSLLYTCILILISTSWLSAQNVNIRAFKTDQSPTIDGQPDETLWRDVAPFTDFKMVEPTPGIAPTEKTEVKVIYNQKGLYLGIRCYDSEPKKISANTMERDKSEERTEDQVSLLIDPFQDKRSAYIFIVNPKGARSEGFAAGEHNNLGWDGLWEAKSKIDSRGWTCEIFIPFKTISFNPKLSSWGINIERYIARKQEVIRYSGIGLNSFFSNPKEAGLLDGIENIKQGLGLTFRPYAKVSRNDNKLDEAEASKDLKGGFDIYKNITPNLVAAVTVNTDFAETEVDQRRLNLTRFPLYYPEKRTFFLEGSDIFEFGSTSSFEFLPFFSRRIGLLNGQQVPLEWGTKVFGKISNTNLAILDVQSESPRTSLPTNMFAGRISQNIFDESRVGIIVTNGSQSGKDNTLAGADFRYKTSRFMGNDNFSIDLWGVKNLNEAKGGNKNGFGMKIDYPNDLIDAAVKYTFFGDSLNPGLGFLPRNAYHALYTSCSFMPRPEKGWLGEKVRQWFFELQMTNYWNLEGALESRQIFTAPINFRTEKGEHIEFNVIENREVLPVSFEVARGVIIPKGDYSFVNYRFEVNTASYRKVQFDFSYRFGQFYDGNYRDLETGATLKLNGYATIELGGNLVTGDLPEGNFSENLYFTKLNLYLTPDLGVSNYLQFDDITNRMGYNGRFFWQIKPGNTLYLVYNNIIERSVNPVKSFRMIEDQILFKVQTTFRF